MEKNTANENYQGISYFNSPFLATFFLNPSLLPFSEEELRNIDDLITRYEKAEVGTKLEEKIRLKNDLLSSYSISKAEDSTLTQAEAEEIESILSNANRKPLKEINEHLRDGKTLTKKDHDRLEYCNISKTLRRLTREPISINDLSLELIAGLHAELTEGLDVFYGHLSEFEPYYSGHYRQDDTTKVGDYKPAPAVEIKEGVSELISWIKSAPSAINIFIFHTALYAIHPFKNGNKRVCRVIERELLKSIGYNKRGLYSTNYYYHKDRDRYYNRLLDSLYKHNLNFFVSFASEALYFSAAGVLASVLADKKKTYLENYGFDKDVYSALRPLVKKKRLSFQKLFALLKRKISKPTLITRLNIALEEGAIQRVQEGRNVYYSISGTYVETDTLSQVLRFGYGRSHYLPSSLQSYH